MSKTKKKLAQVEGAVDALEYFLRQLRRQSKNPVAPNEHLMYIAFAKDIRRIVKG